MAAPITREELDEMKRVIGDAWFRSLSVEERLEGLTPEERIQGLSDDEITRLRLLLAEISKDGLKKYTD